MILCGGSGVRLWPLSRAAHPKQMLELVGNETMLQKTLARVADERVFGPPIIVTGEKHADQIAALLSSTQTRLQQLIVEPAGRNTAPAIALAALAVAEDALLLVIPSDHLLEDPLLFTETVDRAAGLASENMLVTFGVRPTRAETGYGYIRRGAQLAGDAFRVDRFVEKPDAATAASFCAAGDYEWNAGIFLFTAGTYLRALSEYADDISTSVRAAFSGARQEGLRLDPGAEAFCSARAESVDRAVLEHAPNIAVVPLHCPWSDVGSWQAVYEALEKDAGGNAMAGDVLAVDAAGCLIRSSGPLVVAVGVQDLAIIATDDAILIVPRDKSQSVAGAVTLLKARQDPRV